MDWSIRDATLGDVYSIAARLREDDQAELQALHGGKLAPLVVLASSRVASDMCRVGEIKGVPTVLYGVAPHGAEDVGVPWMVGTQQLEDPGVARCFLRGCAGEVQDMNDLYPLLVNYVDERNTLSRRWLTWLGFKFISLRPYGVEQRPFLEFVRLNHV